MRYILKEGYGLRGWDRLPYALVDLKTKRVQFINKEEFPAFSYCNGLVDFDWPLVDDRAREVLKVLLERGIAEPCEGDRRLTPEQEYHKYACRYMNTAHWSITGRCNYKCKHCYMWAPDAKYGELSHEECISIIDSFAECGVYNISITGGEPMVRSDFWELIDRMCFHGLRVTAIYSNGALVTDRFLDNLEKRNLKPVIDMSFDGVGWHDWLRGINGAEKLVTDAFLRCRERGFRTRSEMCLHRLNKDTLRESINYLASLGVSSVKLNPVSDAGAWTESHPDLTLSDEETFELYLEYIPQFFEDKRPMAVQLGGFFLGLADDRIWQDISRRYCGDERAEHICVCGHARNNMYISPDSHVLPCLSLSGMEIQEQFPKITEVGLKDCLTGSAFMDLVTLPLGEFLKGEPDCKECEYRYTCGGGCRAGALVSTGNIRGRDMAFCKMYKGGYIARRNEILKNIGVLK